MNNKNDRTSIFTMIAIIVAAIVVAAGAILLIKKLYDKYCDKDCEYINFGDDEDFIIDECDCPDEEIVEAYEELDTEQELA